VQDDDEDYFEDESEYDEDMIDFTPDHLKLLYMISKYGCCATEEGEKESWIRSMPLTVLIHQGILHEVFDYDYSPSTMLVNRKVIWLNISQEGKDDLDDLREGGVLNALKLSSEDLQPITAYQVSEKGFTLLDAVTDDMRDDVHGFIYEKNELLHPDWDDEGGEDGEGVWFLTTKSGHRVDSRITETEDVSYVSSPYLPKFLRKRGRNFISNKHRVAEAAAGKSGIADELSEAIVLSDVRLIVCEWMPFGANQIVSLCDRLGAYDRCKGGMFTANADKDPTGTDLETDIGLTVVQILDFEPTKYINFEAEINYPEDEGIVQVEVFGMHLSVEGNTMYGMTVDAINERQMDSLSVDLLSRVVVDVTQDSSRIMESLLSGHQRQILDLVFMGYPEKREKYNVFTCNDCEPHCKAAEYLDKEDKECELKQVLGQITKVADLSDKDFILMGRNGLLLCGPESKNLERLLLPYISLLSRSMFIRSFFKRTFLLSDLLKTIRHMIGQHATDPTFVEKIRDQLSVASQEIILMTESLNYLSDSITYIKLPEYPKNPTHIELYKTLDYEELRSSIEVRIEDLKKNVDGSLHELENLSVMAEVINVKCLQEVFQQVEVNTKFLVEASAADERASASLEVMQVVLAASMAFDLVDRFTGMNMNIDLDQPWHVFIVDKLIANFMVWFAVNIVWMCIMCYGLLRLMKWLGAKSAGYITANINVNRKANIKALKEYLSTKDCIVADTVSEGEQGTKPEVKKWLWEEDSDEEKWQGPAPTIEIVWDESSQFILKLSFSVDAKLAKWKDEMVLHNLIIEDLTDNEIFDI